MANEVEATATSVAVPVVAAVPAVDKQQVVLAKIEAGIAERNLEHPPVFVQHREGSDLFLSANDWPTIQLGKNGGITVGLRSYPESNGKSALDAAVHGDTLLAAQNARDAKKAAAKAAAPAGTPAASAPAGQSFETGAEEEESDEELGEEIEEALETTEATQ